MGLGDLQTSANTPSREWMQVAKYSPPRDRIATATRRSIRVWDSSIGHSLVDINEGVTTFFIMVFSGLKTTSLLYPTKKSRNLTHPLVQKSRDGQQWGAARVCVWTQRCSLPVRRRPWMDKPIQCCVRILEQFELGFSTVITITSTRRQP